MSKISQAVVLCAGNGARMKPFTNYYPKCLLPVKTRLALEILLEELLQAKIKKIVFVINENQWIIKRVTDDFFAARSKKIKCVFVEQKIKNGGGGALLLCKRFLKNQPFLLAFSDDLTQCKGAASKQIINTFEKTKKNVMAIRYVAPENAKNYGIIQYRKKRKNIFWVSGVVEKPKVVNKNNFANFGRYAFHPQIFDILENINPESKGEIYLTRALEEFIKTNNLIAKKIVGKTFDVGTPQNYIKTFKKYKIK